MFFSQIACYDVAIIGAGISGTYAAWRLRHTGRKIGIFEQWDRIGGRIHTHRLPGMPTLHAELGAMYYMPQVYPPLHNAQNTCTHPRETLKCSSQEVDKSTHCSI